MPARIIIEAGARSGEYPIEQDVVLLGKDGTCAARPAELAAVGHAATLEYRQGRYTLYNRLPQPVKVGAQAVGVRGSREWRPGERVQLGEAVVLRLEVDGDAAPSRAAPQAVVIPDLPEAPAAEKPAEKKKSKVLPILLLTACVGLAVASFFAKQDEGPTAGQGAAPAVDFE